MNRRYVGWGIGAFGVALAAFLIYRTLSQYTWDELASSVAAVPAARLAGALGFAGASYVCLTFFDWLGLRYAGRPLPWRKAAHASFVSLSLGHNIGFAALSSGAIRYRFYKRWGLGAEEVAKVIAFCAATVGLGLASLAGVACLARPETAARVLSLDPASVRMLGAACIGVCMAWIAASALLRAPLHVWRWRFELPPLRLAAAQTLVGALNFALVAACLHQALAAAAQVDYAAVATAYVIANVAVLVSHVPGGLGVIETVVSYLIPGAPLIGALLVFRFAYFLAPLALGLLTLLATELAWRRMKSP
ncbi:MAG: lysylphosphatidylglycerol synthetase/UPF0104 protein [Hyphomicrobiales bacterium]|jgi:uncharacterized membrane protein YbhN (UPF0104 family)|nr:lysylphosphatidylglycerol synthetase/UPF0104 protein [Hyphomicrobiales bacterium]